MTDKEFWEACGWNWDSEIGHWDSPDGGCFSQLPELTLDSLFKDAVPKVRYFSMFYDSKLKFLVSVDGGEETGVAAAEGKDPALALFWAIWEVLHGETNQ